MKESLKTDPEVVKNEEMLKLFMDESQKINIYVERQELQLSFIKRKI